MEEDREALDALYEGILAQYPPGERRDFWLAWVGQVAMVTRCAQWTYSRPRLRLVWTATGSRKPDAG
jgi:hypothetical protein